MALLDTISNDLDTLITSTLDTVTAIKVYVMLSGVGIVILLLLVICVLVNQSRQQRNYETLISILADMQPDDKEEDANGRIGDQCDKRD